MGKLLLLSILVATFAIPMRAARGASAPHAYRRMVMAVIGFNAAYLLAIIYLFPRLG